MATHPHGAKMMAVVGDDPEGLILDSATGEQIAVLAGHYDYSFAAAWHPDGIYLATGNQVRGVLSAQKCNNLHEDNRGRKI